MNYKSILASATLIILSSCVKDLPAEESTHEAITRHILANQDKVATPLELLGLGVESFFIGLFTLALVGGVAYLHFRLNKERWDAFWNRRKARLPRYFVAVWMMGFCIYLVGTHIANDSLTTVGETLALLCQMPMAAIHALEMFALQGDISPIHAEYHNSLLFMFFFSLVHFLAAAVSTLFIIKYFGYNLVSKFRLSYAVHLRGVVDELYVFWGMNEATYTLAKDIRKAYADGRKRGSYDILVVNTAEDDEDMTEREHTAVERLFSFFSLKKEELNQYKELDCLSVNVFNRLARVKMGEGQTDVDVLQGMMDLRSLTKIIKKTRRKVHVFLLSNDEDENIVGTSNLCRDTTIRAFSRSSEGVQLYCHARYDSVNRVIEDRFSNERLEVKVIDSSHDSINILRGNVEYHPVNFVDIDTNDNLGTVRGGFTSLVLGFGETGRDAVRFLYEYAAFVDSKSSRSDDDDDCHVERAPFRCCVVDKEAERLKGQFFASAPAIKGVEMWTADVLSPTFYEKVDEICRELNYVVFAFGDDELNVNSAVRLFNYVRRKRTNLERFVILVRCHSNEKRRYFQHIVDHYNEMGSGAVHKETIRLFGTTEQLYTYEQVIENDFTEEGRKYNALYCEASGEKGEKNRWDSRHHLLLGKKTLDALSELRRKESQDIANAYHALTKRHIMRMVMENENENENENGNGNPSTNSGQAVNGNVRQPVFQVALPHGSRLHDSLEGKRPAPVFLRRNGAIMAEGDYTKEELLLLHNLARMEHLRWNAAHEVLGYQSYEDGDPDCSLVSDIGDSRHQCNETYKLHNCLIPWQALDREMNHPNNPWHPDYKLYDYNVITTTLMQRPTNR